MPKDKLKKYRKLRLPLNDEFKLRTNIYSLKTDLNPIENVDNATDTMYDPNEARRVMNILFSLGKK